MAAPTYVLSESFYVRDVLDRVEALAGQVDQNKVTRSSALEMVKRYILKVKGLAQGATRKYYTHPVTIPITDTSGVLTLDLTGHGVVDVLGISDADMDSLNPGDGGYYTFVDSWETFKRRMQNKDYNAFDRWAYKFLGERKIRLLHGSKVGTRTSAELVIERTPYVGFTLDEVDGATQERIDVPDIFVPYVETGAALEVLRQAGTKESLTSLADDFTAIANNLNSAMLGDEMRLKNRNADQ